MKVTDTGIGISPDEQQLVFEKFRQGSSGLPDGDAMTREHSGTGLGLSIARQLAEAQGGAVSYEDRAGGGSVFTFEIPAAKLDGELTLRTAD